MSLTYPEKPSGAGRPVATSVLNPRALASAKVLVGSAAGIEAAVTLSGDVTNTNAGVTAIGAGKVTNAMVAPNALDGTVAKNVAAVDVIGGLVVMHFASVATTGATTTDTDIVLTHKTRIIDAFVVKTSAAAANNGANTVQILNATNAITDALSIRNVADTSINRFTLMDDANQTIAAAGTLRVERVLANAGDNNACDVYIIGVRSA